jgi:cupin fold WbuC family metalloprotein
MKKGFIKTTRDNGVVYSANSCNFRLTREDLSELIENSSVAPGRRGRICSHHSNDEPVHEMFVAHERDTYVRPHRHLNKSESMVILTGEVDYLFFDDVGNLTECYRLGESASGLPFYQSTRTDLYHSLIVRSDWAVFLEITKGPFDPSDTVWAPWSPAVTSGEAKTFQKRLERKIVCTEQN